MAQGALGGLKGETLLSRMKNNNAESAVAAAAASLRKGLASAALTCARTRLSPACRALAGISIGPVGMDDLPCYSPSLHQHGGCA